MRVFICKCGVFFPLRLDTSVHLEVLVKQGFGKCYDSQCIVDKKAFLNCKSGINGAFDSV